MKSLAVAGFLIGLIFFWNIATYEPSKHELLRAESLATNFILYRNAVNAYALEHKTEGSIASSLLTLPAGLSAHSWHNRVIREDGELRCYVYGPASPEMLSAVLEQLHMSAAVGWNNKGRMVRLGPAHTLPGFVLDKHLVSVITID